MPSIVIASYSIRFRASNARAFLDLNDARLNGVEAFIHDYFVKLQAKNIDNPADKKVLGAKDVTVASPLLTGRIITGEYGYETDLIDVKGKKQSYRRSTTQAELLPFYFQLYLPPQGRAGILLLQRFGVFGVRSVVWADFLPLFQRKFPQITINLMPQVPDGVLHKIMAGGLKSVILRKDTMPGDICEAMDEQDVNAGKVDIVITGKHGNRFQSILTKIRHAINTQTPSKLNEVVEIEGFEHDKTLIEVEVGGKIQTVDLTNLAKLRARIDITKKITNGADGHPTLDSIKKECNEILASLRTLMGI